MTLPHTASVQRLKLTGKKSTYSTIGTMKCFLQPLSTADSVAYGNTYTKASNLYVAVRADLTESDRVVINGVTYAVAGIKSYDYGTMTHKKAIVEQL